MWGRHQRAYINTYRSCYFLFCLVSRGEEYPFFLFISFLAVNKPWYVFFLKVKHLSTQMRSWKKNQKNEGAEPDDPPTLRGVLWRKFHQREDNKWSGVLNTSCCSELLKISIGCVNWHLENNEKNLFPKGFLCFRLLPYAAARWLCMLARGRTPWSL